MVGSISLGILPDPTNSSLSLLLMHVMKSGRQAHASVSMLSLTGWPVFPLELYVKVSPFSLKLCLSAYFITATEMKLGEMKLVLEEGVIAMVNLT